MATELSIEQAVQNTLQALSSFEDQDVTINDWNVLDEPTAKSPWAIVVTSDDFDSRQDTTTATTDYTVPVWLVVDLTGQTWEEAYNQLRDVRQEIVDTFNAVGTARSAGGLDGVNLVRIFAMSEITYIYPQNVNPDLTPDTLPDYVTQMIGFEFEQY